MELNKQSFPPSPEGNGRSRHPLLSCEWQLLSLVIVPCLPGVCTSTDWLLGPRGGTCPQPSGTEHLAGGRRSMLRPSPRFPPVLSPPTYTVSRLHTHTHVRTHTHTHLHTHTHAHTHEVHARSLSLCRQTGQWQRHLLSLLPPPLMLVCASCRCCVRIDVSRGKQVQVHTLHAPVALVMTSARRMHVHHVGGVTLSVTLRRQETFGCRLHVVYLPTTPSTRRGNTAARHYTASQPGTWRLMLQATRASAQTRELTVPQCR